jgi:ABC-type phosphate transport system substrate-binding protein
MPVFRKRGVFALALVGLTASVLPIIAAGQASADYAPQAGDVVGVGGDTPQFAVDFGANGDFTGAAGFNGSGDKNRLVAFDATSDGNARAAYTNSVTTGAPSVALNPTDVLRAGSNPVQRVQSSGAGITALLDDTFSPEVINYIFSASLPTSGNQTTAANNGWDYLHVVEIGTDSVDIAVDGTATDAPAGLSIQELLGIYTGTYTKWNQLPDNAGGSSNTIIPLIPVSTSSIYKTFIADLTTANGGSAPTLSTSVKTVEQNDPTAITANADPADVIVPFSNARLNLWNSGYFYSPSAVFGTTGSAFPDSGTYTPLTPGIVMLKGTPPDSGAVYASPITDYIIFRQTDASSTTPFEPGSSLNWVQTLFSNPSSPGSPYFASSKGQALIAASGVTPDYVDLGDVS